MLVEPQRYELPLWDFAGETWQRVRYIASFTSPGFTELQVDHQLNPKTLSKLIELQAPFAEPNWALGGGSVTENSCRDALLEMLRQRLEPRGISCDPEVDHVGDKRADIRISFKNRIAIPIEIKGDWHRALWTAPTSQLPRYTASDITDSYGVYLVLWTGGSEQPPPRDRGKKPRSAADLRERLQAYIASRNTTTRIEVFVLDVSWRK